MYGSWITGYDYLKAINYPFQYKIFFYDYCEDYTPDDDIYDNLEDYLFQGEINSAVSELLNQKVKIQIDLVDDYLTCLIIENGRIFIGGQDEGKVRASFDAIRSLNNNLYSLLSNPIRIEI